MEKDRFLFLAQNFTALSPQEAEELVSLQNLYPYSQIIRNLAARASRDHNLDSQGLNLQLSAVYATDRGILKAVMTSPRRLRDESKKGPTLDSQPKIEAAVASHASPFEVSDTPEHLLEELAFDLDRLRELKHNFESLFGDTESDNGPKVAKKRLSPPPAEETPKPIELIEEIKISKKKIKPENPKQKEQLEIIDEFIKTKPTITKGKVATPPPAIEAADLSESSILFSENIVSETLVDLLLKQGKKDKAVEVLKKLIWKFPQKKAYFAAQIEELKK